MARQEDARQELADFVDLLDILDDPDQIDRQLQVSAALVHRAESSPAIRRYAFVQREVDLVAVVLPFLNTSHADADVACKVLALLLTLIAAAEDDDPAISKRNIAVLHKHPLMPLQSLHSLLTFPPLMPPPPSALHRARLTAQILDIIRAPASSSHDNAFLSGIRAATRAGSTPLDLLAALVRTWNAVGTRETVARGCGTVIIGVLEDAKWNLAWWERRGETATEVVRCIVEGVRSGPSAALTPVSMAVILRHCVRVRAMHTILCPATHTFLTSIPPAIHAHLLTIEAFLTAYHVTSPIACLHILSAIYISQAHTQSSATPPQPSPEPSPPPIPQPPPILLPASPPREAHAAGAFAIRVLSKSTILGASTAASTAEFLTLCGSAMRASTTSEEKRDREHADEEQLGAMQRGLAAQCEAAATRVLLQDPRRWGMVVRLFPPVGDADVAALSLAELAPVVARAGGEGARGAKTAQTVAATVRQKPGACDALIITVLETIAREVVAGRKGEIAASGARWRRPLTAVAAMPSVGKPGVTALASDSTSAASRAVADVEWFIANEMLALIDFLQSRVLRPSTLHPAVTACIRTVLPTLIAHTQAPDPPPPLPLRGKSLPNLTRATGGRRLEPLREVVGLVATTANIVQPRPPVEPPPPLRAVGGLGPGMGTRMGRKVALR
ncbi:hypothetical protein BDZ88DRAFT_59734 [Geranomyces variabilis]|nr:hypothetical protein BDZ88DRAFT_59734 [Geranomyces variabilis]KAJ3133837.1 hypothetical protein HDU90_005445 [Geranomyces variabilis]